MLGKRGTDVELLQYILKKMPFLGFNGTVNGQFDQNLQHCIQQMQIYFQEKPDGIVGRDTYRLFGIEVDEYWPSSLPPLGMRTLRYDMRGRDVMVLQNRLAASRNVYAQMMEKETAGLFRKGTEQALRAFQKDCGMKASGILDESACFALYRLTGVGSRSLQYCCPGHDRGYDVFCLQERLHEKGYLRHSASGIFSMETEEAVKYLQQDFQMEPSGKVQGKTCFILGR